MLVHILSKHLEKGQAGWQDAPWLQEDQATTAFEDVDLGLKSAEANPKAETIVALTAVSSVKPEDNFQGQL
jgi:hypothetical protein